MTKRWLWAVAGLTVSAATGLVWAQQAPTLSNQIKSTQGSLTAQQQGTVNAFVQFYTNDMTGPLDVQTVQTSRDALMAAYSSKDGAGFRQYYAEALAKILAPAGLASAQLLVQVNAALVIAAVPEPAIEPALRQMLASTNPALRYLGMKGFLGVRDALIKAGGQGLPQMLAALRTEGEKETIPQILQMVFEAMVFNSSGSNTPAAAVSQARTVLGDVIEARMQALRDGKTAFLPGFREAVRALRSMNANSTSQDKTRLLQLLSDILANGAAAYVDDTSQSKTPPAELSSLLTEDESAMAAITGIQNMTRVKQAAESGNGPALQQAVDSLVGTASAGGTLTVPPWNVTPPKVLSRTPASSPATQPATAPAGS